MWKVRGEKPISEQPGAKWHIIKERCDKQRNTLCGRAMRVVQRREGGVRGVQRARGAACAGCGRVVVVSRSFDFVNVLGAHSLRSG